PNYEIIYIQNNSLNSLYYWVNYSVKDTILPKERLLMDKLNLNQKKTFQLGRTTKRNPIAGKIEIYFFKENINQENWDSVRIKKMYLKKVSTSVEDIEPFYFSS
ncbi:MAG: hypothetical protein ACRCVT_11035, partial [Leadbetterella sp.]